MKIVEKSIGVGLLTATWEYRFVFMYRFRITIFQRSILFKTNNYHHWAPFRVRGPGQLPPLPPLDPTLSVGALRNQRESPLHTEGRNLAKLQMNSQLAKLQVSRKVV